jgi:hypothetical protein
MQERICQAIKAKQLLMVTETKDGCTYERIVEPYLLFATKKNKLVLHSWQVKGGDDKTAPCDWCDLSLSNLRRVEPLEQRYEKPQVRYNPHNRQRFYRVLCYVPVEG